jgi:hypothetical protein
MNYCQIILKWILKLAILNKIQNFLTVIYYLRIEQSVLIVLVLL